MSIFDLIFLLLTTPRPWPKTTTDAALSSPVIQSAPPMKRPCRPCA